MTTAKRSCASPAARRAGWDATWSAPKSVSTAWSQAPPEVRVKIEAAIGLAILVVLFRNRRTINVEQLDAMKG